MSVSAQIEAIHQGDLVALARHGDPADAKLLAVAREMALSATAARRSILARLEQSSLDAAASPAVELATRCEVVIDLADHVTAYAAAHVLLSDGFEAWDSWAGGAALSFRRHSHQLTVARTANYTTVVRLRWGRPTTRSRWRRLLTPTTGDWDLVELPEWAWRAYPLVRLARLGAERIGLRRPHDATLGPFLATPDSLLQPLLEFAAAEPGETVIDLGCGDGRLPVAAATMGCDAVGIESSPELVDQARQQVAAADVADRCRIVLGDARDADLSAADVVVAFLPSRVLADLLPNILAALPAGARVVAHEQTRLPADCLPPDESRVLVGPDALTVAHRWSSGSGRRGNPPGHPA